MRHLVYVCAMIALAALLTSQSVASSSTTATQLTTRFKAATGQKLVANKQRSYPGHYRAYDAGAQSTAVKARFGTFVVFLITATDLESEVTDLLADSHTGQLGTPSAGKIYWEQGVSVYGDAYWQAKRRYGQNVVLTWIGPSGARKTDATWKRLHAALTSATR
jgi:hypothetical protein